MNIPLSKIFGKHLAAPTYGIPPASDSSPPTVTVDASIPEWGNVRITFRLFSHRKGKGRYYSWLPNSVETVSDETPTTPP
jgi:hypothetical protein